MLRKLLLPLRKVRFQFRLRTLLLLPVVFAAGWLWVTWPERTARRFVALLAAGDTQAANAMSDLPEPSDALWLLAQSEKLTFDPPGFRDGSWTEYAMARRRFAIPWSVDSSSGELSEFVAARGRVALSPASAGNLVIAYSVRHMSPQVMVNVLQAVYGSRTGPPPTGFTADVKHNRVLVQAPNHVHGSIRAFIAALDEASTAVEPVPPRQFEHTKWVRTKKGSECVGVSRGKVANERVVRGKT